jgi:UvrD-like helicase C-terminal domain/AAA domain
MDRVLNKTSYVPISRPPTEEEIAFFNENLMPIPKTIIEDSYEKVDNQAPGLVVIVDESSMTNEDEYVRLIALYAKVIFIGDVFQLPPVDGKQWFQEIDPDVTLTEIVRTGALSEITQIANLIRRKSPEWKKTDWHNEVTILRNNDYESVEAALKNADIVLAHRNVTCDYTNQEIRDLRGLSQSPDRFLPRRGDYLLSWETDRHSTSRSFVKSETYEVMKAFTAPGSYMVTLKGIDHVVLVNAATLQQQQSPIRHSNKMIKHFSFAHCITGHKSQGSEWDNVVVLACDKALKHEDYWNWLYTSCTRAKKRLTVIV